MGSPIFDKIYDIVKQIPRGKVATYGQVAIMAGNPHWSQVVGFALHANPSQEIIPCHRVVNRFGEVAQSFVFGGGQKQFEILKNEGVVFLPDGKVDFEKSLWDGNVLE